MPFYIQLEEEPGPALRRIACEQIDKAAAGFRDETMPLHRSVHGLRLCCKKMRAQLRLLRAQLGEDFEIDDQRFRAAAKVFADYRNENVLAAAARSLGAASGPWPDQSMAVPAAAVGQALDLLHEGRNALDARDFDVRGFDDIAAGFRRTYQHGINAWQAVLREPTDTGFHRLRRHSKYHWYQVRMLEKINSKRIRPRRRALHDLQLTLGDAHDLAVLHALLKSGENTDFGSLEHALARKWKYQARSLKLAGTIYAVDPDRLVADFSRWWQRSRRQGCGKT